MTSGVMRLLEVNVTLTLRTPHVYHHIIAHILKYEILRVSYTQYNGVLKYVGVVEYCNKKKKLWSLFSRGGLNQESVCSKPHTKVHETTRENTIATITCLYGKKHEKIDEKIHGKKGPLECFWVKKYPRNDNFQIISVNLG